MSAPSRHQLLGAAAALVAVAFLFAVPTTASADGDVTAVGWWTRLPTASAPEGGINVGSAPDGPNSVAAVRIDLGNGLSRLTVTAVEAGGAPDSASVRACPAADLWAPADGGPLDDAPEIDCTNGVTFERGDDGRWTADVTALVTGRSGTASIGFVADGPSGDNPLGVAPSEVRYERPSAFGAPVPTTTVPATTSPPRTTDAVASPPSTSGSDATPATPATTVGVATTAPPPTEAPSTTAVPTTTSVAPQVEERAVAAVADAGVATGGRPIREAFFLVAIAVALGVVAGGVSKWMATRT